MSNVKDDELIDAGDLRPNQLITNHGPGAVIAMRNDCVMIYGCHLWPKKEDSKRYRILQNELLQTKLSISLENFFDDIDDSATSLANKIQSLETKYFTSRTSQMMLVSF